MSEPSSTRTIIIETSADKVWQALTDVSLMPKWMSETEMEVITDWHVGNSIVIQGRWHKMRFRNTGIVLSFDVNNYLSYSHLSSLSRLEDRPENHSVLGFHLEATGGQTVLELAISNSPDYAIQRHLEFYWSVTLQVLKNFVERQ
jgi:uncharacterized protein YndB with AHSA1/START domain